MTHGERYAAATPEERAALDAERAAYWRDVADAHDVSDLTLPDYPLVETANSDALTIHFAKVC